MLYNESCGIRETEGTYSNQHHRMNVCLDIPIGILTLVSELNQHLNNSGFASKHLQHPPHWKTQSELCRKTTCCQQHVVVASHY